jgi:glycosyltransferase involved in cell wall biosynthesis
VGSGLLVAHLTSSGFFGGPERQMLGLARSLPAATHSAFLLFAEGTRHEPFLEQLRGCGLEAVVLERNTPRLGAMIAEVAGWLRRRRAAALCCHGYKAGLVGLAAARLSGAAAVAVSHGFTAATLKVRAYEALDRACLRRMDRVVCVSAAQAARVRAAGVAAERVVVIRNAIDPEPFAHPEAADRARLAALLARPYRRVVGAAGRLSPEKGFGVLVAAAARVARAEPDVAFVLFGDGPLRGALARQIAAAGLEGRFVLAGFHADVVRFMPHWDLAVLPSFTEGLPNVVLEAYAAGTPVVASAVGGVPEIVTDGRDGYLVPPGDPAALARRILAVLQAPPEAGRAMGRRGRARICSQFTFAAQARQYQELFAELAAARPLPEPVP